MKKMIILFLCLFLLTSCTSMSERQKGVEISGNCIENSNSRAEGVTRLLRVDDTLYYVYNKDTITMKIVEISADGVKTIYTVPPSPLSVSGMVGAPGIQLYEGKITVVEDGEVLQYDSQTNEWNANASLAELPYLYGEYFRLDDAIVYSYSTQEQENEYNYYHYIGCYKDGVLQSFDNNLEYRIDDIVERYPKRDLSWADESAVYYVQHTLLPENRQQYSIHRYAMDSDTDELLFSSAEYPNSDFETYFLWCADEEWIIFESCLSDAEDSYVVYALNTTDPSASAKRIFADSEDVAVEGIYNGCVYLATENGIIRYNLTADEETALCERNAETCYILDDTWVYFASDDASLWRVAQDGSVVEHVYG